MHEVTKYLKSFIKNEFSIEIRKVEKMANKSNNNKMLLQILNDIISAEKQWNKIRNQIIVEDIHEEITKKTITSSFMPTEIKTYLIKYNILTHKCVFNINNQLITVFLSYLSSSQIHTINKTKINKFFNDRLKLIYLWLHVSNKYRDSKCSNTVTINIYLSDLYKILPEKGVPLDEKNVNTAITTSCVKNGQIFIYREEEWFKVLMHETFHVYGMDFTNRTHISEDFQDLMDRKVSDIISVKTELRFFETYCEISAEWLNILFYTYFNLHGQSSQNIVIQFYKNFVYEKIFSIIQSEKLLNHYGIDYINIFNRDTENITSINNQYKEKTYVLSYNIFKSVYMFNLEKLFEWYEMKNGNSLRIKLTEENMDSFLNLLKENYQNSEYLNLLQNARKWIIENENKDSIETKTCRMSMFEI